MRFPASSQPVWFTPTQTGQWEIACSQLCGLGHYRMKGFYTIQTQADYDAWLKEEAEFLRILDPLAPPSAGAADAARRRSLKTKTAVFCGPVDSGTAAIATRWPSGCRLYIGCPRHRSDDSHLPRLLDTERVILDCETTPP